MDIVLTMLPATELRLTMAVTMGFILAIAIRLPELEAGQDFRVHLRVMAIMTGSSTSERQLRHCLSRRARATAVELRNNLVLWNLTR